MRYLYTDHVCLSKTPSPTVFQNNLTITINGLRQRIVIKICG